MKLVLPKVQSERSSIHPLLTSSVIMNSSTPQQLQMACAELSSALIKEEIKVCVPDPKPNKCTILLQTAAWSNIWQQASAALCCHPEGFLMWRRFSRKWASDLSQLTFHQLSELQRSSSQPRPAQQDRSCCWQSQLLNGKSLKVHTLPLITRIPAHLPLSEEEWVTGLVYSQRDSKSVEWNESIRSVLMSARKLRPIPETCTFQCRAWMFFTGKSIMITIMCKWIRNKQSQSLKGQRDKKNDQKVIKASFRWLHHSTSAATSCHLLH